MLNIRDNFNENIEYCLYIYSFCNKNFLNVCFIDIQDIANKYVDELIDLGYLIDGNIIENDDLVYQVIEEYYDYTDENAMDDESYDEIISSKLRFEKEKNAHGGYCFDDNFDDVSFEDRNIHQSFSLRKKPYQGC